MAIFHSKLLGYFHRVSDVSFAANSRRWFRSSISRWLQFWAISSGRSCAKSHPFSGGDFCFLAASKNFNEEMLANRMGIFEGNTVIYCDPFPLVMLNTPKPRSRFGFESALLLGVPKVEVFGLSGMGLCSKFRIAKGSQAPKSPMQKSSIRF